jgi:hypothetical protein
MVTFNRDYSVSCQNLKELNTNKDLVFFRSYDRVSVIPNKAVLLLQDFLRMYKPYILDLAGCKILKMYR